MGGWAGSGARNGVVTNAVEDIEQRRRSKGRLLGTEGPGCRGRRVGFVARYQQDAGSKMAGR